MTPGFPAGGLRAMMLSHRSLEAYSFLRPFTWGVWVSVLLSYCAFSLTLFFISRLSQRLGEAAPKRQQESKFSFAECIEYFSLIPLQLGVDKHPQSFSGRLLMQVWSLYILVVISTYTANLAAFFGDRSMTRPLSSIEDILPSRYNVTYFDFFDESNDNVYSNNKSNINNNNNNNNNNNKMK